MDRSLRLALFVILCLSVAACDSGGTEEKAITGSVVVNAQANVFAAGLAAPPPDSIFAGGGGRLPVRIDLPPGATSVSFSSVEGIVGYGGLFGQHGADGGGRDSTDIDSYDGIAGIVHRGGTFFFLTGVFLSDRRPGAAPARRNATGANQQAAFSDLAIGQTFFVGDGRTVEDERQRFAIPAGATRFYLGFADTSRDQGLPGAYSDNSGDLAVDYRIAVEDAP